MTTGAGTSSTACRPAIRGVEAETGRVEEISVGADGIRLGQLLKLANLVESGGLVRPLLAKGAVTVNGAVETRRGAQLRSGDVVVVGEARIIVG
jgi:ribosome-associated protein